MGDRLDETLLVLPNDVRWTARNAVEGVQIFGGVGSGKTTGSGRTLAIRYLEAGYGGLVLTVKAKEKDDWIEYCEIAGRPRPAIIEPNGDFFFNFLDYEASVSKENALTDNLVQVLKTVIHASEGQDADRGDDKFWDNALDMLIFNVIDLCKLAYGKVTIKDMYDIVEDLPGETDNIDEKIKIATLGSYDDKKVETEFVGRAFWTAMSEVEKKLRDEIDKWEESESEEEKERLSEDQKLYNQKIYEAVPTLRTVELLKEFFFTRYKNLSDKTRSIVDFSFSGFLFRLLRDPVYSLFCDTPSNITPEDCLNGRVILVNLPVKQYHKVGRDVQVMFKYIWQRAMERRQDGKNPPPVFLWADEAQNFLHEYDAAFQATAREPRIATVYISQNLPNYYANMGGEKRAEHLAKSFLGTLNTKIFHSNGERSTNEYASELIGDAFFEETVPSLSITNKVTISQSKQLKVMRIRRPEDFTRLLTGGEANDHKVEAFMHVQGSLLREKNNYTPIRFDQRFKEPKP